MNYDVVFNYILHNTENSQSCHIMAWLQMMLVEVSANCGNSLSNSRPLAKLFDSMFLGQIGPLQYFYVKFADDRKLPVKSYTECLGGSLSPKVVKYSYPWLQHCRNIRLTVDGDGTFDAFNCNSSTPKLVYCVTSVSA